VYYYIVTLNILDSQLLVKASFRHLSATLGCSNKWASITIL